MQTEQEKIRIVKRYCSEKIHAHALAREEGVTPEILGMWIHKYLEKAKGEFYA